MSQILFIFLYFQKVEVEYFEEALDAASELEGVDGGRVAMVGNSKGEKKKGVLIRENGGFLHYSISEPWWPLSRLKLVVFPAELQVFLH